MLKRTSLSAWRGLVVFWMGLMIAHSAAAALPAAANGEELPSLAPMLEEVTPAVVNIATRGRVAVENPLLSDPFFRRFFDVPDMPQQREVQNLGSGVIVDAEKGYILTNHHVIQNADEIQVNLADGRTFSAEIVGTDPESDVAVIQIEAENLATVPWGQSEELRVGDFVVAIGNPFGLGQTVTSGMVSALGRSGLGIEGYENFIQTDASINPGNSGGALVNLRGELVGINTAILSQSGGNIGIGFAIPANMARAIMEQLIEHGEVRRGRLGILVQDLTPQLAEAFGIERTQGAVVARVQPDSPAEEAGLKEGDVIVAINGETVDAATDVRNQIGLVTVGERIRLRIYRDGAVRMLTAEVGSAEEAGGRVSGEQVHRHLTGSVLVNVTDEGEPQGVGIARVEPGSPAGRAGLRQGDLIVSANRQRVRSVEELRQAVADNRRVLLNLRRGNSALFLLLE